MQELVFSRSKMWLDFDKTLKVVHQTTNRKKIAFVLQSLNNSNQTHLESKQSKNRGLVNWGIGELMS